MLLQSQQPYNKHVYLNENNYMGEEEREGRKRATLHRPNSLGSLPFNNRRYSIFKFLFFIASTIFLDTFQKAKMPYTTMIRAQ